MISFKALLPAALEAPYWDDYITTATEWERQRRKQPQSVTYVQELTTALEESHKRNPNHDEVHLKLAALYELHFEIAQQRSTNPMPLSQIRSAVLASDFRSAKDRDQWLSRAVGDNLRYLDKALYHARRAVQLCPLQGEAYVYISKLAFLHGTDEQTKAHIEQGLRVRPYSGAMLFEAGSAAVLDGDVKQGLTHLKKAFHQAPLYQTQIIERFAPHAPAQFFLEQFEPGVDGLARLFSYYRQAGRDEDARLIGHPYVGALEEQAKQQSGSAAAQQWKQAYAVHRFLENDKAALRCIRRAAKATPIDVGVRRALAEMLIAAEQFDEAIREIEWCMRRTPKDDSLRKLHVDAHRQRLARRIRP